MVGVGGNDHWVLHLPVLDVVLEQTGGSVDMSAGVLRVTSGVWAEPRSEEESSMPGQSNITLVLSVEVHHVLQLGTD